MLQDQIIQKWKKGPNNRLRFNENQKQLVCNEVQTSSMFYRRGICPPESTCKITRHL